MKTIAAAAKADNQHSTEIADQMRKDSKVIKALTMTATLYLPASLVAVSSESYKDGPCREIT